MKFQEMFDQAIHHVLIIQSGIMTNSVKNAVYQMTSGRWEPRYTRPCYSNTKTSAATASRAPTSAAANISSQLISSNAALACSGSAPMPSPFFQLSVFQPVGTPVPSALTYTTSSPMTSSASKNLFSTSPSYVPTLGMPPYVMNSSWPQQQDAADLVGFTQNAPP